MSTSAPVCSCGSPATWRRTFGIVPTPLCEPCKVAAQRRGGLGYGGAWEPIPKPSPIDHGRPGIDLAVLCQHATALRAGLRSGDVLFAACLLDEAAVEIEALRAGRAG